METLEFKHKGTSDMKIEDFRNATDGFARSANITSLFLGKINKEESVQENRKGETMNNNILDKTKRVIDPNWDFREADTKEFTHCIHTYPAMMIPQIARKLTHLYGKNAKTLLDPFMGSGTSLVEASLTGNIKTSYGFDLNPLAVLISKVKTTPLDIDELNGTLKIILRSEDYKTLPDFKNIEFWFKSDVIEELAKIKLAIDDIEDEKVKNFFLVAFSETVRNVSNTRKGEFKLYRITDENLIKHDPNVFEEFKKIAEKNIQGMKGYITNKKEHDSKPQLFDTKSSLPLESNSIDIIVTSPPYGDSRTTVAYGQFSRLALQWLGYDDAAALDKNLLGGMPSKELDIKINSPTLKQILNQIANKDVKRAREVLSFYEDFDNCVTELNRVMKKGGYVCFVVGNRTVKEINIPTDLIMTEMFKAKGKYKHITTYVRDIPFKRMPKANSPTNEKGKIITTMNNEFIFILQKI